MRSVGLRFAADTRDSDKLSAQNTAAPFEDEVIGWWAALNAPPVKQNDA